MATKKRKNNLNLGNEKVFEIMLLLSETANVTSKQYCLEIEINVANRLLIKNAKH